MFFCALCHRQSSAQSSLHLIDQGHLGLCASTCCCQTGQEEACKGRGVLILRVLSVWEQMIQHKSQHTAVLQTNIQPQNRSLINAKQIYSNQRHLSNAFKAGYYSGIHLRLFHQNRNHVQNILD